MTTNDLPEFLSIMNSIVSIYNRPMFTDFTIQLWFNALNFFSIDEIKKALSIHIATPEIGRYMPVPADIVNLIEGSNSDKALTAWTKVDRALRVIGTYQDIVFDDAIIHVVIEDMGGWISFGEKLDKEWPFVKNDFIARYKNYSFRKIHFMYLPVLTGICTMQNISYGTQPNSPIFFGKTDLAKKVYEVGKKQISHATDPIATLTIKKDTIE